jgi:hypothetical protein
MTTIPLDTITLAKGAHGEAYDGKCCIVECSNLIAARRIAVPDWAPRCPIAPAAFADDHPSISRVIRAFAIGLNDAWDDTARQRLRAYAPRLLCTATGDADEATRAWMAVDWLIRVHTPAFLRLAGLTADAEALEALARISDATLARAAQPALNRAREHARAARDAVWAAAGAAARDAAGDAAWDAAWDAARAAAGAAAGAALQPTVAALQDSALQLLDAMIAVGQCEATP